MQWERWRIPVMLAPTMTVIIVLFIGGLLYGLLQSTLLFYKKLRKDLEEIGFKVNPCDHCVANMDVGGNQLTIT